MRRLEFKYNTTFYILFLFAIVANLLYYQDVGVVVFPLMWVLIGSILITVITTNKNGVLLNIFLLVFSISFILNTITTYIYVTNPLETYFFAPDNITFYKWASLVKDWNSIQISSVFDFSNFIVRSGSGFFILNYYLGKIAQLFGSDYPYIAQLSQNSFYYAFIGVVIYKIIFLFQTSEKALRSTFILLFLSPMFIYSLTFIRDIPIAFYYLVGFYILFQTFRVRNILILFFLAFVVFLYRPTSGILFLILPVFYILISDFKSNNKLVPLMKVMTFIFGVFFIAFIITTYDFIDISQDKVEHYSESHQEKYEEADGLTSGITKLPIFLQGPANIILGQLTPFPFYRLYKVTTNVKGDIAVERGRVQYLSIFRGIGILFWFYILFFIIKDSLKKKYKALPRKVNLIFLLSVLIISLTLYGSPEIRRALGIIPIFYLYFLLLNHNKRRDYLLPSFFYLALVLILFIIKM